MTDKRGSGAQGDHIEARFPLLWIDSNHAGRPPMIGFQEPSCTYGTLAITVRLLLTPYEPADTIGVWHPRALRTSSW